jgi:hypothetical protein
MRRSAPPCGSASRRDHINFFVDDFATCPRERAGRSPQNAKSQIRKTQNVRIAKSTKSKILKTFITIFFREIDREVASR